MPIVQHIARVAWHAYLTEELSVMLARKTRSIRVGTLRRAHRSLGVVAGAAIAATAFVAVASADDISNNLDGTIDAAAEVMPLNAGGAAGTTNLYVTPRNGDGKNGCNLTGQHHAGSTSSRATRPSPPSALDRDLQELRRREGPDRHSALRGVGRHLCVSDLEHHGGDVQPRARAFTVKVTAPPRRTPRRRSRSPA